MKKFRIITVHREYWEFEVEGYGFDDATDAAQRRMANGDWGKPVEGGRIEIFDVEEIDDEGSK